MKRERFTFATDTLYLAKSTCTPRVKETISGFLFLVLTFKNVKFKVLSIYASNMKRYQAKLLFDENVFSKVYTYELFFCCCIFECV